MCSPIEQQILRCAQNDMSLAYVLNAPDTALRIVREVQLTVAPLSQAHGTSTQFGGFAGCGVDESVHEHLEIAARASFRHRLKHDPEAFLRLRRAIPGAVEHDERTVAVPLRQLFPCIEEQRLGRPVRGESADIGPLPLAAADVLAITAVLGREHLLVLLEIEVAIGPAEIRPTR